MRTLARTILVLPLGGLLLGACATDRDSSSASACPQGTVSLSVPFPAGGPTDTEARLVARAAGEELGKSIVVRNVEGAGGAVLWNEVPDMDTSGAELVMYNLPHIVSHPMVRDDVTFDSDSFAFIVHLSIDPTAFFVSQNSDLESLEDLIAAAGENAGGITVGTAGRWLAHHLAILELEALAEVTFTDQPFGGSAPEIQALLGGHVDVASGNVSDVLRSGEEQFRVLAVAAEERSEFLPDAPTFKELGYEIVMSSDRGIAAPAGVDEDCLTELREGFETAVSAEAFQDELREIGSQPHILVGDEIDELVRQSREDVGALLE